MTLFTGLSAFPLTPTDSQGRIDLPALSLLLERLEAAGVDSVGLLGSTGTYAYLAREERRRAVAHARKQLAGRVPFMVGAGSLRTDDAQAIARDAADAGADALLLAPVSYTPLLADEVYQHYVAVAGATPLPLCVYNNPSTTHFEFSHALLERLAAIPNIKAVKMPSPMNVGDELRALRAVTPAQFSIGYSGDWGAAPALLAGADAWYSVLGGLFPVTCLQLTRAAQAHDVAEAERINARLQPVWGLFKAFGSLRVMYAAANIVFSRAWAAPRPILPLGALDKERVAAAIHGLA